MPEEPWTILKLLRWTTGYFKEKRVAEPRASAEVLLAHVLCKDRLYLYLNFERPLESRELSTFRDSIKRRLAGEPTQYITGRQEFWSLPVRVTPDVLIPRPETETLVEAALDVVGHMEFFETKPRVMDLGTGSGAIAIALARELPAVSIVATDLSVAALKIAKENAVLHKVEDRVRFICSNMFAALSRASGRFDVVVTNPPYVSQNDFRKLPREIRDHEPRHALDGGPDGLSVISRVIQEAPEVLRQRGGLLLEMGDGQADEVAALAVKSKKFKRVRILKDYSGVDRVLVALRGE